MHHLLRSVVLSTKLVNATKETKLGEFRRWSVGWKSRALTVTSAHVFLTYSHIGASNSHIGVLGKGKSERLFPTNELMTSIIVIFHYNSMFVNDRVILAQPSQARSTV
jgi:hypothetical protein